MSISPFNCNISNFNQIRMMSTFYQSCHRFCKHYTLIKIFAEIVCLRRIFLFRFLQLPFDLSLSSAALGSFTLFVVDCIIGFENCVTNFQTHIGITQCQTLRSRSICKQINFFCFVDNRLWSFFGQAFFFSSEREYC